MSTIGFIRLGAIGSRIVGFLPEKHIRRARQAPDGLGVPLPSATVAEKLLARERQLGYAHWHLAALHEVLAGSPAA
jgi:hypothetical protein